MIEWNVIDNPGKWNNINIENRSFNFSLQLSTKLVKRVR